MEGQKKKPRRPVKDDAAKSREETPKEGSVTICQTWRAKADGFQYGGSAPKLENEVRDQ